MKKVLGFILELNPFHNGHYYFIQTSLNNLKPDYTIAVVSGNYTMRGDISVIDKFSKTRMLLKSGIDIVLELPYLSTVNSADYFASNAIAILNEFKITNISFGAELKSLNKLKEMQKIIENEEFNKLLRHFLNKGFSYPASALRALKNYSNDSLLIENFSLPNNTLAVQYLRSIENSKRNIDINIIERINNNFYDKHISGDISSATALRKLIRQQKNIASFVPEIAKNINYIDINKSEQNLFILLKYRFIDRELQDFKGILGINEGIENRFISLLKEENNYERFIKKMQTKRYPLNKIQRLILHILLDTGKTYEKSLTYYLRMLGATEKGLHYIRELSNETKQKIITSFKNTDNEIALNELKASKLYDLLTGGQTESEEYKIPIIEKQNI